LKTLFHVELSDKVERIKKQKYSVTNQNAELRRVKYWGKRDDGTFVEKGRLNDLALSESAEDTSNVWIKEDMFVEYFINTWHAGLELFTEADLRWAVVEFKQAIMEAGEGYPETQEQAADVIYCVADPGTLNSRTGELKPSQELNKRVILASLEAHPELCKAVLCGFSYEDVSKELQEDSEGMISHGDFLAYYVNSLAILKSHQVQAQEERDAVCSDDTGVPESPATNSAQASPTKRACQCIIT